MASTKRKNPAAVPLLLLGATAVAVVSVGVAAYSSMPQTKPKRGKKSLPILVDELTGTGITFTRANDSERILTDFRVATKASAKERAPEEERPPEAGAEGKPRQSSAMTSSTITDCGLELRRNGIEIVSWDSWMRYAPDRFVAAIRSGLGSPEEILGFVFQEIWPALRWPPPEDSPYRDTWDRLVARVDQSLPRVASDGRPRLRIL
jgi:hypothetical protein